jgi:D-glycero-alpha-D-manno-heptose-7-phosphate kinase
MIASSPHLDPVPSSRRQILAPRRRAVASAPMRVSFAGGGSDVPPIAPGVGGRVVGTAVDLRVRAVVEPFDPGWVRLELSTGEAVLCRRSTDAPSRELEFRLAEAALAATGIGEGVRLRIETEVVPGAGLGGSASAAVAALAALAASIDRARGPGFLAGDAVSLERRRLGVDGGEQDQIFAASGGIQDITFDDAGGVRAERLDLAPGLVRAIEEGLLLVDSGSRRVSGEVLGRTPRRPEITAELVAAAGDVARGLAAGSLDQVLAGMRRNAAAKVRRLPEASAEASALAERLTPLGAEVVRVCGAGGGGHVLVWAPPSRHAAITAELAGSVVRRPPIAAVGVRIEEA